MTGKQRLNEILNTVRKRSGWAPLSMPQKYRTHGKYKHFTFSIVTNNPQFPNSDFRVNSQLNREPTCIIVNLVFSQPFSSSIKTKRRQSKKIATLTFCSIDSSVVLVKHKPLESITKFLPHILHPSHFNLLNPLSDIIYQIYRNTKTSPYQVTVIRNKF